MRIVSGFTIRNILSEIIAVPSSEAAHQLAGLVSMNETGELLFHLLQEDQTMDSLVKTLMDTYEVDEVTAKTDVENFLNVLRKNNLLLEL